MENCVYMAVPFMSITVTKKNTVINIVFILKHIAEPVLKAPILVTMVANSLSLYIHA